MNWKFETAPQPQMHDRRLYLPRGKTLGGSSSINGMLYVRGNHRDYDEWRQRGCIGWDWDSVLPWFKKAENQARGADEFPRHRRAAACLGPVDPGRAVDRRAGGLCAIGHSAQRRFQWRTQEGCGYYQTTTLNQRRWSAAKAYLSRAPSNLTIVTKAHATRIVIENGRATGVEYHTPAGPQFSRARAEVIVSGGAFGSPQLLLLSGLGPAQHLAEMGIDVIRDMPAVGSNLHDHFNTTASWRCSKPITLNELQNSMMRKALAGVRYALFRSGPMAGNGVTAGLFTRSDPRLERPTSGQPARVEHAGAHPRCGDTHPFRIFADAGSPAAGRPRTVRLNSADPFAPPAVLFDYLRTDYDIRAAIGIGWCARLRRSRATALRGQEIFQDRYRGVMRSWIMSGARAYPTSIRPARARWGSGPVRLSIRGCGCTGSPGFGWPMRRSCRSWLAATPMRRRS